jgi:hypothetical protein
VIATRPRRDEIGWMRTRRGSAPGELEVRHRLGSDGPHEPQAAQIVACAVEQAFALAEQHRDHTAAADRAPDGAFVGPALNFLEATADCEQTRRMTTRRLQRRIRLLPGGGGPWTDSH